MVDNVGFQAPRSPSLAPDFQHFLELLMNLASLNRIDQEDHIWDGCWESQDLIPQKSMLVALDDTKQMKLRVKIAEELEQDNFDEMSARQWMQWMKWLGGI